MYRCGEWRQCICIVIFFFIMFIHLVCIFVLDFHDILEDVKMRYDVDNLGFDTPGEVLTL